MAKRVKLDPRRVAAASHRYIVKWDDFGITFWVFDTAIHCRLSPEYRDEGEAVAAARMMNRIEASRIAKEGQ